MKRPIVPGMFIVCDNKFELVGNNIVAIPDFKCEIVSAGSVKMDKEIRKELYLKKGVLEYGIADYYDKSITVCYKGNETNVDLTILATVGHHSAPKTLHIHMNLNTNL